MLMIAALAATVAGTKAAAPTYPVTVSGWLVVQRARACAMGTDFAGPGKTYVFVQKRVNDEVVLSITNEGWSAREDEVYEVSYQLNGKEYADGATTGYRSGAGRGFWSIMGDGFERDFAAGSDLSVFLDGKFIRKISLVGTGRAIAALDRCVADLHSRLRPGKADKRGEMPLDPFAQTTSDSPERNATEAEPKP
jgi:hypothetical protein